jgi:uncharacterized protein YqgC (DUF456 family)
MEGGNLCVLINKNYLLKNMDIIFWVALGLMIIGIVGSVLPVIPGPILSFFGLIIFYIFQENEAVSGFFVFLSAVSMLILVAFDYILPIMGAKFAGASKKGQWGAVIGALLGMVLFPPLGIFVGALIGAMLGEMQDGKRTQEAMRAALGIIVGGAVAIILQIAYSAGVLIYFLAKAL